MAIVWGLVALLSILAVAGAVLWLDPHQGQHRAPGRYARAMAWLDERLPGARL